MRLPRRTAFTLLELLISLALLMLVTGLLVGASRGVTSSWSRLNREQATFGELVSLDRVLDNTLSNAIPFMWRDQERTEWPFFLGQRDAVRLACRHRVNHAGDGALRFVQLSVREGDLVAVYQSRPALEFEEGRETVSESVLARGVKELRFSYADWLPDEGIVWLEEWDPITWEPLRKEIPLAIAVMVIWEDGHVESWLRRTAGSGEYERLGVWKHREES